MEVSEPSLLLLLPGLDGTGRLFARFVAELPETIEPRVLPLPAERPMSYDELLAWLREQLPSGRRFCVLGESFSGPLALQLAALRPTGLIGAVLVASFHLRPAAPWIAALGILARPLLSIPPPEWAIRRFLAGPAAAPALVREIREAVRSVPPSVLAARVRAALAVNAADALEACPVPLLYLGGAEDRILRPALPAELQRIHPAAHLRQLAAPHLVLQAAARESARLVAEFVGRCSSS